MWIVQETEEGRSYYLTCCRMGASWSVVASRSFLGFVSPATLTASYTSSTHLSMHSSVYLPDILVSKHDWLITVSDLELLILTRKCWKVHLCTEDGMHHACEWWTVVVSCTDLSQKVNLEQKHATVWHIAWKSAHTLTSKSMHEIKIIISR